MEQLPLALEVYLPSLKYSVQIAVKRRRHVVARLVYGLLDRLHDVAERLVGQGLATLMAGRWWSDPGVLHVSVRRSPRPWPRRSAESSWRRPGMIIEFLDEIGL